MVEQNQSPQLFVFTASNRAAQDHINKSIANPISPAICDLHCDSTVLARVRERSGDGQFYAWGATSGRGNQSTWGKLELGDHILAYQKGRYTFRSRVVEKLHNTDLARAIWGLQDGETWELMYFLRKPIEIDAPASDVSDVLPASYQGFQRIVRDRPKILNLYGSVGNFLDQRFPNSEDDEFTKLEDDQHESELKNRIDIPETEKAQLVNARRGQGVFKTRVGQVETKCRITGVSAQQHLRASHIKPWRDSSNYEKLDGNNGLLLSPHVDHLFDRGYISFTASGSLLVSPQISHDIFAAWNIDPNLNVGNFLPEQEIYLAFHRDNIFKQ